MRASSKAASGVLLRPDASPPNSETTEIEIRCRRGARKLVEESGNSNPAREMSSRTAFGSGAAGTQHQSLHRTLPCPGAKITLGKEKIGSVGPPCSMKGVEGGEEPEGSIDTAAASFTGQNMPER